MSLRSLLVVGAMALLHSAVLSQSSSGAKDGAKWLESRLINALEERGALPPTVANHAFRYVFLFDSSQADSRSPYLACAQKTIADFLNARLAEPGGPSSKVGVFFYQMDLYNRDNQFMRETTLSPEAITQAANTLPRIRQPNDPDGRPLSRKGGHDHVGPLRTLVTRLRQSGDSIPTVVIQLSTIEFGEHPGEPNDPAMRLADRAEALQGSSFVQYATPGLPLRVTAEVGMYMWVYGPSRFDGVPAIAGARIVNLSLPRRTIGGMVASGSVTLSEPAGPVGLTLRLRSSNRALIVPELLLVKPNATSTNFTAQTGAVDESTEAIVTVVGPAGTTTANVTIEKGGPGANLVPAIFVLLLAAVAGYWFLKPLNVNVLQGGKVLEAAQARRGGRVALYGPGATKTQPNAIVLPASLASGVRPDHLGTVVIPTFGAPYVKGDAFMLDGAGLKNGKVFLDRARPFRLKSKSDGSSTESITIKVS